ncbi:MAG: GreA/GreB family elongation factor [Candidatus Dojkabacteria bacterium]
MAGKQEITKEGYDKLLVELERRKTVLRREIADKIEKATEQGDLSENSAYKSALEEKELNESKINELEQMISDSVVLDGDDDESTAGIGDSIVLKDIATGKDYEFNLVGKSETDPALGSISIDSPIGRAVSGKRKGDEVEVNLPLKTVKYKLVKIG